MKWLLPFIFSIILGAALAGGYSNTLHSPFVFDDINNIVKNPSIKIDKLDASSFGRVFSENHPTRTRRVANLSFALNYLVGGENPSGYHLVNILIHILTSFAVFRLFYLYLRKIKHSGAESLTLAFAACLIWALNPMQTNAVTYIVQRMTSMSVLFMVLSILMYFQARTWLAGEDVRKFRFRIGFLLVGSLLFWCAAMMTKEIAVIMPVLIFLHEYFFFGGFSAAKLKKHVWFYVTVAVGLPVLVLLYIGPDALGNLLSGYRDRDFTLGQRLLTEPRVVLRYMSLFLLPLPSRLMLYYNYPVSQSLFVPLSTALSIGALGSLLFCCVYYAKRLGLVAFGILWTFICLLVESSFLPLEIIFEHRFYLPSIGFSLAIVYGVFWLAKRFQLNSVIFPVLFTIIVLVLTGLTHTRNETWKNEIDFHLDGVKKAPMSLRSHLGLAVAYMNAGDVERGRKSFEKAYELDGENVSVLGNLFIYYSSYNSPGRASYFLSRLKKSLLAGNFVCTQANVLDPVARTLFSQKRYSDAALVLETLSRCNVPAVVYQNLAVCYQRTEKNLKAIENFQKALHLKPGYPYYLYQLAYLYYLEGDHVNAMQVFSQLNELPPSPKSEPYIRELKALFVR